MYLSRISETSFVDIELIEQVWFSKTTKLLMFSVKNDPENSFTVGADYVRKFVTDLSAVNKNETLDLDAVLALEGVI